MRKKFYVLFGVFLVLLYLVGYITGKSYVSIPKEEKAVFEVQEELGEQSLERTDKQESYFTNICNPFWESEEELNPSIYDFLSYPYDELKYIDESAYTFLKEVYQNIDFDSEFEIGDVNIWEEYKNVFKELVDSKRKFLIKETGEERTITEFFADIMEPEEFNAEKFRYYFFDMDGEKDPELCISDGIRFVYIFKYDAKLKQVELWKSITSTWEELNGTLTYRGNREGTHQAFYKLNEKGEEIFYVGFFSEWYGYDEEKEKVKEISMVSIPMYYGYQTPLSVPEEIKCQGVREEGDIYYFRVTEEQYRELTKDYFKAEEKAKEELQEVSYDYQELFGEI